MAILEGRDKGTLKRNPMVPHVIHVGRRLLNLSTRRIRTESCKAWFPINILSISETALFFFSRSVSCRNYSAVNVHRLNTD